MNCKKKLSLTTTTQPADGTGSKQKTVTGDARSIPRVHELFSFEDQMDGICCSNEDLGF